MNNSILLLLAFLLCTCAPGTTGKKVGNSDGKTKSPPNILFIIGDDHSTRVMGSYGNPLARTPNLDRLAASALQLDRAFVNAPVCSASRQSFITGRYPHASGVTLLSTPFPEEQITIAEHLLEQGYETAVVGKTHFNNNLSHGYNLMIGNRDHRAYLDSIGPITVPDNIRVRPPWKPFRDPANIWLNAEGATSGLPEAHDQATFFARQSIAFMERNREKPFFLCIGFNEPHSPFNFPIEYQDLFRPDEMPLPTGSPEDDRWIPEVFKDLTTEERRGIIAAYYTSVAYLDRCIGQVMDGLERLGLRENTIVVYIGDHGYLLNDHKRYEKHMMWEPAIQAPLLMRLPGQQTGLRSSALVEFVDIVPTMLEAAGLPSMPTAQGKSFFHLFSRAESRHKSMVFSEFLVDNKVMVRTDRWKYIFTTGKEDLGQGYATGFPPPGITHRLYDLAADPDETRNVAHLPENAEVLSELQQHLLRWFAETHPKAAQLPPNLPVEQQLVFFCEPPDAPKQ